MWWARASALDLFLGERSAALCGAGDVLWSHEVSDFREALALASRDLGQAGPRRPFRVWLGGSLCRPFIMRNVGGLARRSELQRLAQGLATEQTGLHGRCHVWLERAEVGEHCALAAALTDETLQDVLCCVDGRGKLKSISPWWSAVLASDQGRSDAAEILGVHDGESLTVLGGRGSAFQVANTVTALKDLQSVNAAWLRIVLTAEIEAPATRLVRLVPVGSREPMAGPVGALAEMVTA